jgi:4-amino-4-deoxy-L-arabinose transferase-like glycosyltransferase
LLVVATLGHPGITSDEPLDVQVGLQYLGNLDRVARLYGGVLRGEARRIDADVVYGGNAQHPPLGRWLVGIASALGMGLEPWLGGPSVLGVHAARLAPAAAFGVLAGLVAAAACRLGGAMAGVVAGIAMIAMPRVFAHGHFATLDTFASLFWVAGLLAVERATRARWAVGAVGLAGVVWGLALLTKIHGWLLIPLVAMWVPWRLGWRRGIPGLLLWGLVGLGVFIAGWPWLWFDTIPRLAAYLGTSTERLPLRVLYFGRIYLDREVPWHYPWVYFVATVPVGLQALGLMGVGEAWRRRRHEPILLAFVAAIVGWLVVFSTRAPVYDGERLFLMAFPLWAILIGVGFGWLRRQLIGRREWPWLLALGLASQLVGVVLLHPYQLSYYSPLVGGLSGAERLGLELTYWGDAVDPDLVDTLAQRVQPGQTACLAPTLHAIQAPAQSTVGLLDRGVTLQDEAAAATADWVLAYRREAYWTTTLADRLKRKPALVLRSRQGVWLSGLWGPDSRKPAWPADRSSKPPRNENQAGD